jgi:hypothetical protein
VKTRLRRENSRNEHTNIARRVARCIALPAVAAGIIGGAALSLAGTANAAEGSWSYDPQVRTGIAAEPKTKAKPPAEAYPGAWWHRHNAWLAGSVSGVEFEDRVGGPTTPIIDDHGAGPVRRRLGMRWAITVRAWASSSRARCEPKQ